MNRGQFLRNVLGAAAALSLPFKATKAEENLPIKIIRLPRSGDLVKDKNAPKNRNLFIVMEVHHNGRTGDTVMILRDIYSKPFDFGVVVKTSEFDQSFELFKKAI